MNRPYEFDAFYKDTRSQLLLQTYALTGDLAASRSAVRDTFVVAWHLWPKISRLPDPESWARPHAWSHAQRRHTARLWHRDKGLDPGAKATLDALAKLPVTQRKALILTHLASVSMSDLAREVGLPRAEAERVLQTATAQFAVHRDVATTNIRPLFEPLREQTESATWPRPSILRRAGAARRRTHTLVGVGIAVAAVVVSGSLVTDASGVRPTLGREPTAHTPSPSASPSSKPEPPETFTEDVLLTAAQVAQHVPGRQWTETSTSENTEGNGRVLPCQESRFADPRGVAALVREFDTTPRKGGPQVSAIQETELSASPRSAHKAFNAIVEWYAGCAKPRTQLMSTHRVDGVADDAMLIELKAWGQPNWTYVAGVARTGRITTTTLASTTAEATSDLPASARLLATAVDGVCHQPDGGACPVKPRIEPVAPVPVGMVPGMVVEVDLPPVDGVPRPWVGTEPRRAMDNDAATSCDQADFRAEPMSNNVTRTFVIPGSKLPVQFGLTETVGTMPAGRAKAFVEDIRQRMEACPDKDLGTEVERVAHRTAGDRDLTVWHVTTELSDDKSVSFLMGIVREGTAIGQVGFVPDGDVTMAPGAFVALVERAGERLPALPRPS
jgi:DNA-directed RNA polymerase specialized sigma24 family protein